MMLIKGIISRFPMIELAQNSLKYIIVIGKIKICVDRVIAVSYTHLDVYKRQLLKLVVSSPPLY